MPDRQRLASTIWLAAALTLAALVMAGPTRTSEPASGSSRPDCLRRELALPPVQPATYLGSPMAKDAVLRVTALASEDEGQDRVEAPDEPRASFLIPRSFRKIRDSRLLASRSISSLYPLRC